MAIFEKEKKDLEQRVSEIEKEKAEAEQKATNATTQHNNLKVGLDTTARFKLILKTLNEANSPIYLDQAPPTSFACSRRYDG